jgi:peptide/nickel transport system permease protein
MLKQKRFAFALAVFVAANACLLLAGLFAPYAPAEQHRDFAYAPPTRVHFFDDTGHFHLRPFVYAAVPVDEDGDGFQYEENRATEYPIRLFTRQSDGLHALAVTAPANLFILGTDGFGRDIFSRILFGGRISIGAALLATLLSLCFGAGLGAIAGHFGGAADASIMRGSELALALPWIYLLLAIRAVLPLHLGATQTFLLISAVIGVMGWARPARLVRGVVLSARERPFVMAARGFGASEWYLLRRHVLPQALGIVITQAVILVPQFVTAEATLSFLGLGMTEPIPSWGNMLSAFQHFQVMSSYWWMVSPVVALVLVSASYFALANALDRRRIAAGEVYA